MKLFPLKETIVIDKLKFLKILNDLLEIEDLEKLKMKLRELKLNFI